MSRLIIKNLPNKVSSDKLKDKFSKFGDVTDVQLKMTPDGRFRKFAFIGFKTNEQANAAMDYFDNTFYNSSKITVQICRELGSELKPKSWSKHAKDSVHRVKAKSNLNIESKLTSKQEKTLNLDSQVIEKIKQHCDEPEFAEFIALNSNKDSKVSKVLDIIKENDGGNINTVDFDSAEDNGPKLADAPISDAEYLKLKTKGANTDKKSSDNISKASEEPKQQKYERLFTIKIKNLPAKVKKKDIKDLLKPLVPASIRRTPCNSTSLAFVGFKTQKELRQSLIKNKSFLKGQQIQISEYLDNNGRKLDNKWEEQENSLKNEETVAESGRIFVRNLPYSIKEEEIENLFSKYGPVTEIILPLDKLSRKGKGYGLVTFLMPEHAATAFAELDGTIFQGRMLHLLPGKGKDEEESEGKGFKVKKETELKAMAGSSHNWNTLFLGQNALADLISESYGADKAKVLSGTEGGVRLALGETQLVAATREFLISNGVCLEAFNAPNLKRSKQIILVKNLPAKTTEEEIREKFQSFGIIKRLVMPPSGITALVEFEEPAEAKSAFKRLAYTKFKNLPLYLEWAPDNTFAKISEAPDSGNTHKKETSATSEKENSDEEKNKEEPEPDTTLFVKNLNFETTEEDLKSHFNNCGRLAVVSISKKKDASKPGQLLSMGYGFVQFYRKSDLNRALADLQNSELQGHKLELKRSTKTLAVKPVAKHNKTNVEKQTGKKILVRNIPFQANKKEIELLFKTFGELKMIRLPKKMIGTGPHRGFAFVEYVTLHDAKQAMNALCHSTHLYGRRLVLEWAEEEEDVETIRKRTAKHFHPAETKRSKKGVADIEVEEDED